MLKIFKGVLLLAILNRSQSHKLASNEESKNQCQSKDVNSNLKILADKFCRQSWTDDEKKLAFLQKNPQSHKAHPISHKKTQKSSLASTASKVISQKSKIFILNFLLGFFGLSIGNTDVFDKCVDDELNKAC